VSVLQTLNSGPVEYVGSGVNHEGEHFVGTLRIQRLLEGAAVMLHYEAMLENNEVAHAECTLLAPDMNGTLTLWPVMSELPGVLPHRAVAESDSQVTFASGSRENREVFREEITITCHPDGALTYSHAWGLPGGTFEDRSSCSLRPR
jgi:hypothetical protein